MDKGVLEFWFNELEPKQWFLKDLALDAMIETRFGQLVDQARAGELFSWRATPLGRFGRYPHRNAILGRTSTVEELAFLEGPDSSF